MGDGASERRYFDDLRSIAKGKKIRSVDLGSSGEDKILAKCMTFIRDNRIELEGNDELAIVTDNDGRYTAAEAEEFGQKCEKHNIQLYISNTSFEVWLLMHYSEISRAYTQEELESALSKALGKKYSKSSGIPLDEEKLKIAMQNAEKRLPYGKGPGDCINISSSTMVHYLVSNLVKR